MSNVFITIILICYIILNLCAGYVLFLWIKFMREWDEDEDETEE